MKLCLKTDCILHGKPRVKFGGDFKDVTIAFVGESPGRDDETMRLPFIGEAGRLLREQAAIAGLSEYNCLIANSAMCYLPKDDLKQKQINTILSTCRSHLSKALSVTKPKVIVTFGALAAKQIIKATSLAPVRGTFIWSEEFNCWVLPTYSPAHCLVKPSSLDLLVADLSRLKTFLRDGCVLQQSKEGDIKVEMRESIQDILESAIGVSYDTETQGLDYINPTNVMISYSIATSPTQSYQVMLHELSTEEDTEAFTIPWEIGKGKKKQWTTLYVKRSTNFDQKLIELRQLFESHRIKKVMMNGNYDIHHTNALFKNAGQATPELNSYTVDIQLLAHLVNENIYARSSLELLRKSFTTISSQYDSEFNSGHEKSNMLAVPKEDLATYAGADACVTFAAAKGLVKALNEDPEKDRIQFYFKHMVMPVTTKVLYTLEQNGVPIDMAELPNVKNELLKQQDYLYLKLMAAIPTKIKEKYRDKRSPEAPLTKTNMIREMLYTKEGLNIPMLKDKKKKPTDSVDKKIRVELLSKKLSKKASEFIDDYNQWTILNTLLSRYVAGIEKATRIDGKIHSSFSLGVAATGRSNSLGPNLQNIPKRGVLSQIIRKLFIAPPGYVFISADASQCLVPETEIYTIDGIKTLAEVIEHRHPVLSMSKDYDFEFKDVVRGWCTGENEVFEMLLEDGSKVAATANHKFYDYYGNIKRMDELDTGDRLLHAHFNFMEKQYPELSLGLERSKGLGGHTNIRVHRVVAKYLNGGAPLGEKLVHHIDGDKNNWVRSNIEVCDSNGDHVKKHHSAGSKNANYGNLKGKPRVCPVCGKVFYRPPSADAIKTCSRKCGDILFPPSQRRASKKNLDPSKNHRIIRIKSLGIRKTYQIEVADNHNYVLANGLLSKNCELRFMCHLAQEPTMLEIYKSGGDIHGKTAEAVTGKTREEMTDDEYKKARQQAKACNFGFLYGAGWRTFQRVAKIDYGVELLDIEAQRMRDTFFETYPKIKEYHRKVKAFCHQHKYVISPLGRVRHLPEIDSTDSKIVQDTERQALNHAIQSVASDSVLLSALEIMKVCPPDECTPVLFIHDELTFQVREDLADKYARIIKHHMINPPLEQFGVHLNVPLGSDCKLGRSLGAMVDYELD